MYRICMQLMCFYKRCTAATCLALLLDLIHFNTTNMLSFDMVAVCHFLLVVASISSMLQPRHNLLPLCSYRKQGGKCKGVDTNPTDDQCCQDLEVLVLLLLTSSLHSRLQPLLVAEPGKSNLSQPSAARADLHRPWHQTTPHINTNHVFFAWRFPRYGHVDDKIMRCT